MKITAIAIPLLAAAIGVAGAPAQLQALTDIELQARVEQELTVLCYDYGCPPRQQRLLALGDKSAVGAALLKLLDRYSTAVSPSQQFGIAISAIFELGKLSDARAVPVLRDLIASGHPGLRIYCIQSLAEIDASGNRDQLLRALRSGTYSERKLAAAGLARTDDPALLTEIEVQASQEDSKEGFAMMRRFADEMRARIEKSVTRPR